jgi:hypothetical protein
MGVSVHAHETDAAGALYRAVGFRWTSTATWYRAVPGARPVG